MKHLLHADRRLGLRVMKTGIAVTVCVVTGRLIGLNEPLVAVVATILSMGKSIDMSVRSASYKMAGVAIGCVFGGAFSMISHGNAGLCGIGAIACFYLCRLLGLDEAGPLSCFLFAAVMFGGTAPHFWRYALVCGENALLGIGVAVIVNLVVMPPNYARMIRQNYGELGEKIQIEIGHAANRQKIDARSVESSIDQLAGNIRLYVLELKPLRGDDANVFAISCKVATCRMIADELKAVGTLLLLPDGELTEKLAAVYRYHMDRIRSLQKSLGDGAGTEQETGE